MCAVIFCVLGLAESKRRRLMQGVVVVPVRSQ